MKTRKNRINENQKITLTLRQLKRLVAEENVRMDKINRILQRRGDAKRTERERLAKELDELLIRAESMDDELAYCEDVVYSLYDNKLDDSVVDLFTDSEQYKFGLLNGRKFYPHLFGFDRSKESPYDLFRDVENHCWVTFCHFDRGGGTKKLSHDEVIDLALRRWDSNGETDSTVDKIRKYYQEAQSYTTKIDKIVDSLDY